MNTNKKALNLIRRITLIVLAGTSFQTANAVVVETPSCDNQEPVPYCYNLIVHNKAGYVSEVLVCDDSPQGIKKSCENLWEDVIVCSQNPGLDCVESAYTKWFCTCTQSTPTKDDKEEPVPQGNSL